jgi:hypothetical protein
MTDTDEKSAMENPVNRSAILLNLMVTLLAPMFLGLTAGDIGLARMAALETVNAYRARDHADLIAITQIIGFGLAALTSLSLSMADDISASMVLRLRGNANACNRSAEQNRRALSKSQADDLPPHRPVEPAEPEFTPPSAEPAFQSDPDSFLSPTAAEQLEAESHARLEPTSEQVPVPSPTGAAVRTQEEKRNHEMWAIAMAKESSDITASIPNLPHAQREAATMRAAMLSSTAYNLIHGTPAAPLQPRALAGITHPDASRNQSPPA